MMYEFLVLSVVCLLLAGGVSLYRSKKAQPRQWVLYGVFGIVSLVAFAVLTATGGV